MLIFAGAALSQLFPSYAIQIHKDTGRISENLKLNVNSGNAILPSGNYSSFFFVLSLKEKKEIQLNEKQ